MKKGSHGCNSRGKIANLEFKRYVRPGDNVETENRTEYLGGERRKSKKKRIDTRYAMSLRKNLMKKKVSCHLLSCDGNVFSLIAEVNKSLRKAKCFEQAAKFCDLAWKCHSYQEVLTLITIYVKII